MKQNFIGFADSDKFLAAIDRSRPINLNISRKPGRPNGRFGIAVDSTVLRMSQVLENEVLYFEQITNRYQVVGGRVLDADENRHVRLAEQVDEIAQQYLTDHGVTWREALLSMPRSYTTLNGSAPFLQYDKESDSFSYRKAEAA